MDSSFLPSGAAYTPEGAISFPPSVEKAQAVEYSDLKERLLELSTQISALNGLVQTLLKEKQDGS